MRTLQSTRKQSNPGSIGVQDVVSSHDAGTTIFSAPEKVDEDKIRQVIKDAGYEVTGITQE